MNQQEIRDAIDYFERLKVYAAEYEKEYPESKQAPEKIDLAITALRAQIEPVEPCEMCRDTECSIAGTSISCPPTGCCNCKYDISEANFCQNCGRRLDLLPSKSAKDGDENG